MSLKTLRRSLPFVLSLIVAGMAHGQPLIVRPAASPGTVTTDAATLNRLLGGPTKISLRYENADFQEVMKDATQRFGVPLALPTRTAPKGPITLNVQDQPLWNVWTTLRENVVYSRTALSETPRGALLISPVLETNPALTIDSGVFQLRASSARISKKNWSVVLSIFADPKLEIVPSTTRLKVIEATDENGRDLLTEQDRTTSLYMQMPLLWVSQFSQSLPENIGSRLKRIRGMITTTVIVERQPWNLEIASLPAQRDMRRDGNDESLCLAEVKTVAEGRYEIQLARVQKSLINPRFWDYGVFRRNELLNQAMLASLKVLDADGRPLYLVSTNADYSYEDAAYTRIWTLTYSHKPREGKGEGVEPKGPPAKIAWNMPADVRTVEVPFEFNDMTFVQQ